MRHFNIILIAPAFILIIALLTVPKANAQEGTPAPIAIFEPLPGQAIQGNVLIIASTAVSGFQSAELSFGYANNPTQTWFLITESTSPVNRGKLAEWDTSTLTDGNYVLRLVVTMKDGSQLISTVPGLRVRNYSPIETKTPLPSSTPAPRDTPQPTVTTTPSATPIRPTPTPLPPNPAQLTQQDIMTSLGRGIAGICVIFALIGLYNSARKVFRKE